MDTEFLLEIMAVFTGVAAVSLVAAAAAAAAAAIGVWRSVNALRKRTESFMDRWEPVAESSLETLAELRRQTQEAGEALARIKEVAGAAQGQIDKVEALVGGLSETAQKNMARVDETMRKTMERIDNATAAVERTIRMPAERLRAVGAGLNAAMRQLLKGRRRDIDRIEADEEMFI